ncbi:hypothetical protein F5051DRAFT_230635 [Lentinula edodes]|nr:hypothetical protein F5051DRAFT_230635 [Lentinula edodes]
MLNVIIVRHSMLGTCFLLLVQVEQLPSMAFVEGTALGSAFILCCETPLLVQLVTMIILLLSASVDPRFGCPSTIVPPNLSHRWMPWTTFSMLYKGLGSFLLHYPTNLVTCSKGVCPATFQAHQSLVYASARSHKLPLLLPSLGFYLE